MSGFLPSTREAGDECACANTWISARKSGQLAPMPQPRGLEKRGLNRVIAELCWRDFLYTPNCTGEGAGIPFVEVPPGRHVSGMLTLRTAGSQSAVGADPSARRVRPRAGPRREHGPEHGVPGPADLRRRRCSMWDGTRRSRGFCSTLIECRRGSSRRRSRSARGAAPGSGTARIGLDVSRLDSRKSLKHRNPPWQVRWRARRSGATRPAAGQTIQPALPEMPPALPSSAGPDTLCRAGQAGAPDRLAFSARVGAERTTSEGVAPIACWREVPCGLEFSGRAG